MYDYDLVGRVHFRFGFLNYAHCAVNATSGPPASRTRTSNTQVLGSGNVSGSTPPKHITHQSAHMSSPTSVRSLRHRVCVLSGFTALKCSSPSFLNLPKFTVGSSASTRVSSFYVWHLTHTFDVDDTRGSPQRGTSLLAFDMLLQDLSGYLKLREVRKHTVLSIQAQAQKRY